jgi:hypothetical protein
MSSGANEVAFLSDDCPANDFRKGRLITWRSQPRRLFFLSKVSPPKSLFRATFIAIRSVSIVGICCHLKSSPASFLDLLLNALPLIIVKHALSSALPNCISLSLKCTSNSYGKGRSSGSAIRFHKSNLRFCLNPCSVWGSCINLVGTLQSKVSSVVRKTFVIRLFKRLVCLLPLSFAETFQVSSCVIYCWIYDTCRSSCPSLRHIWFGSTCKFISSFVCLISHSDQAIIVVLFGWRESVWFMKENSI